MYLGELSIPGTHDSGTANVDGSDDPQTSFSQTQKNYIEEQLILGVRSFDIRLGPDEGSNYDPVIKHGGIYCKDKDGSWLRLSDVIETFDNFLKAHPGETIIALMSAADIVTSKKNLTLSLEQHIEKNPKLFWGEDPDKDGTNNDQLGNRVPTLDDARGKVVLMHRFSLSGNSLHSSRFGISLTDWGDYNYEDTTQAIKIYDKNDAQVWVQDYYNTSADGKYDHVSGALYQAKGLWLNGAQKQYLFNYTSCTSSNPFSAARNMNDRLAYHKFFAPSADEVECVGIVTMDYIDGFWARKIYMKNFGKEIITFPESASLTYGQTLSEAQFDGAPTPQTDGYYCFKEGDVMPQVADSEEVLYEVDYVERASGRVMARTFMPITVAPRKVTVFPQRPTTFYDCPKDHVLYADPTNIPFDIIKGSVLDGDEGTLGVRFYAVDDTLAPIDDTADAGEYRIAPGKTDTPANENYKVTVNTNSSIDRFTILPKPIDITWKVKPSIAIDADVEGSAIAEVTHAIRVGDDVTVRVGYYKYKDVESEKIIRTFTEKGLYWAYAEELSGKQSGNYLLMPQTRWQGFEVGSTFEFPSSARMTYGQNIKDAIFDGGSGNGTFSLVTKDGASETPEAGTYSTGQYYVKSSSTEDEYPIIVFVEKKPITVKAYPAQAEYGSPLPEFTFLYDENDLVFNDGVDDLGLSLGAFDESGKNLSRNDIRDESDVLFNRSNAGSHTIKKDELRTAENNYLITVLNNTYTIQERAVELHWENYQDRAYDGNPSDVYATITNLIPKGSGTYDECLSVIDGGSAIDAGTHRALITDLSGEDSANYFIPSDVALYQDYKITRAEPSDSLVTFPQKATLSFGQALSLAITDGTESNTIPGTFSFVRKDFAPNAGTYSFQMIFVPEDLKNYKTTSAMVEVDVAQIAPVTPGPFTVEIPAFQSVSLSFVTLPEGWTWDDPAQTVEHGEHTYAASYHLEDSNYFDVESTPLTVTGTGPITVFPEYATLTYGQTLAGATFVGGHSDIPGYFSFADPSIMPHVADSDSSLYTIEFVALLGDGTTQVITGPQIPIKVTPLPITIQPLSSTMEYGTGQTDVAYNDPQNVAFVVTSGDFIGHDQSSFGLRIYALGSNGAPLVGPIINAGSYSFGYSLAADGSNVNYDVTIAGLDTECYVVTPRIVELSWTGQGNIKVDDTINDSVKATVANLVQGDDCTVDYRYYPDDRSAELTDNTYSTYGFYQAYAAGLQGSQSDNYAFSSDDQRWLRYFVRAKNDDVKPPESISLTYGQNISEALFSGESGDGIFELRARDGISETPEAGEYTEGYYVVFIPSDPGKTHPEIYQIPFEVKKRPITAKASHGFSRYGSALPSFTFVVNNDALVLQDTIDDLGLRLNAFDGLGNNLSINNITDASGTTYNRSPFGIYTITKDQNLSYERNYQVTVIDGYFAVARRPVSFSWSGDTDLVYTGNPAQVTAQINNLVPTGASETLTRESSGSYDDCMVLVEGGTEINADMHRAVITGLTGEDSGNYTLPAGVALFQNYLIEKAVPAVPGPFEITIPAGQTLSLSAIELPTGWAWVDGDTLLSVGTHNYEASFHDAQGNYLDVVNAPIQVIATQEKSPNPPSPNPSDPDTPGDEERLARTGDSLPFSLILLVIFAATVTLVAAKRRMHEHQ